MSQKEFGFEIKLTKPIEEYSDEEIDNLCSDLDMLEGDVERLQKLIDTEMKRRSQ